MPAGSVSRGCAGRWRRWLATTPPERLGSGRFWHDRRPRPEHPLPWTREHDPAAAHALWDYLCVATATGAEAAAGRPV
jgi:hypothetical protein